MCVAHILQEEVLMSEHPCLNFIGGLIEKAGSQRACSQFSMMTHLFLLREMGIAG